MRFGVGIPTCREGTAYPVPYVRAQEFPTVARRAEALGYHSLWANDHYTAPHVIQATQEEPPNFYEPLVTYASLVGVTTRLRFVLSVVVLPQREVVLLARQVAALDVLSGGRVMLGLGIGGYREEFEAVHPELQGANRGAMLEEGIEALQRLFSQRRASYEGRYVRFREIELAPKPLQTPFPIYVSAHAPASLRRTGRLANGLIVAALSEEKTAEARRELSAGALESGRDPAALGLHFQIWLSFGKDQGEAEAKLRRSQHFRRMVARHPTHSEAAVMADYRAGNLFGNPEDVIGQLRRFERGGVEHVGVVFLGETMDELLADMELFAERVVPAFAPGAPA
jgi:probable F420-dependent oxidoreductase